MAGPVVETEQARKIVHGVPKSYVADATASHGATSEFCAKIAWRKHSARAAVEAKAVGPSAAEACETGSRQRRAASLFLALIPSSARLKERIMPTGDGSLIDFLESWRSSYWWRPTASSSPPSFRWSRCAAAASSAGGQGEAERQGARPRAIPARRQPRRVPARHHRFLAWPRLDRQAGAGSPH